jgi:hypothetical protein
MSAIPITEKLLLNAGGWQAMKPARELLKGGRVSETVTVLTVDGDCTVRSASVILRESFTCFLSWVTAMPSPSCSHKTGRSSDRACLSASASCARCSPEGLLASYAVDFDQSRAGSAHAHYWNQAKQNAWRTSTVSIRQALNC